MTQIRAFKRWLLFIREFINNFLDSPRSLRLVQKIIDTAIPLGCWLSQFALALTIAPPPTSILAAFGDPSVAYIWSLCSFIAYTGILIGVWINPTPRSLHVLGDELYLYFEYPGLISASVFTCIYGIALILRNGLLSIATVSAGFAFAISIYFLCRYLRTWLMLRLSRKSIVI